MEHKTLIKIGGSIFLLLLLTILLLTSCEKTFDASSSHKIIFARSSVKGDENNMEIWLTDSEGKNQSLVIRKKEGDFFSFSPLWSPDGKKIAFKHQQDAGRLMEFLYGYKGKPFSKICMIDYAKGKEMTLTDDSLWCREFSWSPDGKRLAFSAGYNIFSEGDIYVVEIDNQKIEKIASTPNNDMQPIWSPDGENIAFISRPNYGSKALDFEYIKTQGNSDIYMVNVKSKSLIKLTDNPTNDVAISWSPDGKKIAYMSWRGKYEIFVIDIDTKNKVCLTNSSDGESMPQWSPDGKKIAFFSDNMLYLMDSDGKNREKLIDKTQCSICYEWRFRWSPDSKKIVFVAIPPHLSEDKIYGWDIYLIDIESKELKNLTNTPDYYEVGPSWRPVVK